MSTIPPIETELTLSDDMRIPYDVQRGLSESQVHTSRQHHGSNRMTARKRESFWHQFFENFKDPIIRILLISLVLSVIVSIGHVNWFECIGIAAAVLIATLVSTISEYSSAAAFEALLAQSEEGSYTLRRDGRLVSVPVSEIVAGDVVFLSPGCTIPADGLLIQGDLRVDQSALSGESAEKKKNPVSIGDVQRAGMLSVSDIRWDPDDIHQLFRGSRVCSGEGELVVLRVGDTTYYGGVAAELSREAPRSPLKDRLGELARSVSFLGYVAAAIIAFAYLFSSIVLDSGMDPVLIRQKIGDTSFLISELLHALTVAISVLVVAVPEGLPMMITVVLSSNMKRMLQDGVLVRRLVGIETAGNMNILFTDKTGTLTCGQLRVAAVCGADARYDSRSALGKCPPLLSALLENHGVCVSPVGGNATDRAMSAYIGRIASPISPIYRVPFDSVRRYSSGVVRDREGCRTQLRGAPEKILPHAVRYLGADGRIHPMTASVMDRIQKEWRSLASSAHRVIVAAEAEGDCRTEQGDFSAVTFYALIAIRDGIRRDAASSVATARQAGIQTVMITGDNPLTAAAIARECGILPDDAPDRCITGEGLAALTDEELKERLPRLSVVARALPADKSRLVRLAQEMGMVAGMTGDGINDTPALRAADVGFAMGSGTDAAREAASIVITDDRFSSIMNAALYGRTVFRSIRKFIVFQLSMNLCAVGVSLIGPFIGVETPVTVIQMLWVNIIMDTLGALAFAGEPPLLAYLRCPPPNRREKLLSSPMIGRILGMGGGSLALCLWFLKSPAMHRYFSRGDEIYYLTVFFALFIFCGITTAFLARADSVNIVGHLSRNRAFILIISIVAIVQLMIIYFGGTVFRCDPLTMREIALSALLSGILLPVELIRRLITRQRRT